MSVLRTLPKTYGKHPSSAMVVDDDSRVQTKKMAGKQVVGAPLLKSVHPYQFEPLVPLPNPGEHSPSHYPEEKEEETNRLGNTDW